MIDEIDRQIVTLLQQDARLSVGALAEQVGLTSSTVYERVKKLERRGIIKGYAAIVDPQLLGKSITAFVRLTVGTTSQGYSESKNCLREICLAEPDILEGHGVAGEDCYILKVRVANTHELEKLIDRIRSSAPISRSVTNIVLSTFKEGIAIEPEQGLKG
jgi:Lrp/AsnC family leucine-responsive transcriptional regulator